MTIPVSKSKHSKVLFKYINSRVENEGLNMMIATHESGFYPARSLPFNRDTASVRICSGDIFMYVLPFRVLVR